MKLWCFFWLLLNGTTRENQTSYKQKHVFTIKVINRKALLYNDFNFNIHCNAWQYFPGNDKVVFRTTDRLCCYEFMTKSSHPFYTSVQRRCYPLAIYGFEYVSS